MDADNDFAAEPSSLTDAGRDLDDRDRGRGATSAGSDGGSGPGGVTRLVDRLRERRNSLVAELDRDKASVQAHQDTLQGLTKQVTAVQQADEMLARTGAEADTAVHGADEGLAAAAPLHDTLEDDVKEELQSGFADVESEIEAARASVVRESTRNAEKQTALQAADATLATARESHAHALAALTGLPKSLKGATDDLKRQTTEMDAAVRAGHALKAYVIAQEVRARRDALEASASDAHEAELVGAWEKAESDLEAAREQQARAKTELADQQKAYDAAQAEHKKLVAGRAARLRKLWVPTSEPSTAEGA